MIFSTRFTILALSLIQVTIQTSHRELFNEDNDIKAGYLRQGQNNEMTYESNKRGKTYKDDNDKKMSSNVKVSYNGEVVYDNNRIVKTTTRRKRTYRTTRKRTETNVNVNENRVVNKNSTGNRIKCKKCFRVKKKCKDSYGRPCKVRECRDSYDRPCKPRDCRDSYDRPCKKRECIDSYDRPCKERECIDSYDRPCKKRNSWSNFWNYIVGNQVEEGQQSLCKLCEDESFLSDTLTNLGIKDSICDVCKTATCTDYYGSKYSCYKKDVVQVEKDNGDVSISVNSFFDTYQKLRDAIDDPNALPRDFHF